MDRDRHGQRRKLASEEVDHLLNQSLHQSRQIIDSEFWLRTDIVISKVGTLVLLVNLFIYCWTFRYLYFYDNFLTQCPGHDLTSTSHFWVMLDAWYLLATGTLVLSVLVLAVVIKLSAILSYAICPLKFLAYQKVSSQRHCCCLLRKPARWAEKRKQQ